MSEFITTSIECIRKNVLKLECSCVEQVNKLSNKTSFKVIEMWKPSEKPPKNQQRGIFFPTACYIVRAIIATKTCILAMFLIFMKLNINTSNGRTKRKYDKKTHLNAT